MPDGTFIVRAFTWKNFIFRDVENAIVNNPLENREIVKKLGQEYDVQKNRMNVQVVTILCLHDYPEYFPVNSGLNLFKRATNLGFMDP